MSTIIRRRIRGLNIQQANRFDAKLYHECNYRIIKIIKRQDF